MASDEEMLVFAVVAGRVRGAVAVVDVVLVGIVRVGICYVSALITAF